MMRDILFSYWHVWDEMIMVCTQHLCTRWHFTRLYRCLLHHSCKQLHKSQVRGAVSMYCISIQLSLQCQSNPLLDKIHRYLLRIIYNYRPCHSSCFCDSNEKKVTCLAWSIAKYLEFRQKMFFICREWPFFWNHVLLAFFLPPVSFFVWCIYCYENVVFKM